MSLYEHRRILELVAAPPGWRLVYSHLLRKSDLDNLVLDRDLVAQPIACFALVERWESNHPDDVEPDEDSRGVYRAVEPVTITEACMLDIEEAHNKVAIIAPDEGFENWMLDEARRKEIAFRERVLGWQDPLPD